MLKILVSRVFTTLYFLHNVPNKLEYYITLGWERHVRDKHSTEPIRKLQRKCNIANTFPGG